MGNGNIDRTLVRTGGAPTVSPSAANIRAEVNQNLAVELQNTSQSLQIAAFKQAKMKFSTTASQRVADLYKANSSDPSLLQNTYKDYRKSYMKDTPSALKQDVGALFDDLSSRYMDKAKVNQEKIVNNESQYQLAVANNQLTARYTDLTTGFFGSGLEQATAYKNTLDGIQAVALNYSVTKQDGTPMYTPEQRIQAEQNFAQTVLKNALSEAVAGSENPMALLAKVRGNDYMIPPIEGVTDVETPLSQFLPVDKLDSLGKTLAQEYKTRLDLSQAEKQALENEYALRSFQFETGFHKSMAAGQKPGIDAVEEAKPYLEKDQFVKFATLANTVAPTISKDGVVDKLYKKQARGDDITDELLLSYAAQEVSDQDYINLETGTIEMQGKPVDVKDATRASFMSYRGVYTNPMTGAFTKKADATKWSNAMLTYNRIMSELEGEEITYNQGRDIIKYSVASGLSPKEMSELGIVIENVPKKKVARSDGSIVEMNDWTNMPNINVKDSLSAQRKQELVDKYKQLLQTDNIDIIFEDDSFAREYDRQKDFFEVFE